MTRISSIVLLMIFFLFAGCVLEKNESPEVDNKQTKIFLEPTATGFKRPTHMTHGGDGTRRLFVVEEMGRVVIIKNGKKQPIPFLDITDRVGCCGERGLLSVAFPPS